MAKERRIGSLSRFLYSVGESVRFCPDITFAPARSEDKGEEKKGGRPFHASRLRIKSSLAKMCEQSFFLTLLSRFYHAFFTIRVRSFGVLFFSCGFLQILSYFLGGYVPLFAGSEENLLFGVSLVFLALLCSFSRGDVRDALKKSFLFRAVLSPLLGVKMWQIPSGRSRDHSVHMIFLGLILAFFSVLFSPVSVLRVLFFVLFAMVVFHVPEAGLLAIGAAFFTMPFSALLLFTGLTLVAFLFKCAVGKRSLVFSPADIPVLLFLLPVSFSGGREGVLLFFALLSLYYLLSCLLRTLSMIRRFLVCVTLGGVFCALLLCERSAVGAIFPTLLQRVPELEEILFVEPDTAMGALFVILCPVAIGLFRSLKGTGRHLWSFFTLLSLMGAILCIRNAGLWIALVLALVVFYLFTYRSFLIWLLSAGLIFVTALSVLPVSFSKQMLSFFGFSEGEFSASLEIRGLFGQMAEHFGVLFFPCLILVLGFFLYEVIHFAANATRPEPFPQVLGAACGALALLAIGIQPVSADVRAVMFLMILISLPRAALRCAKREEQRLPY